MKKLLSVLAVMVAFVGTLSFSSCMVDETSDEGLYIVSVAFPSQSGGISSTLMGELEAPYKSAIATALGTTWPSEGYLQINGSTTKFDKLVKTACSNAESQALQVNAPEGYTGSLTLEVKRTANPGTEVLYRHEFTYTSSK